MSLKDLAFKKYQQEKEKCDKLVIEEVCDMIKIGRPDTEIIRLISTYQNKTAAIINAEIDGLMERLGSTDDLADVTHVLP